MKYKEFKKYIPFLEKKDRIWFYFLFFLEKSGLHLIRKYVLIVLLIPIYLINTITSYICDTIDPNKFWFFGKKRGDVMRKIRKIIKKGGF